MGNDEVGLKMSKIIDVPGKINFHVAVDDDLHNVVLMMVGTNNSKKIRMLRAFNDLAEIELIITRLQKAKVETEKLRAGAVAARKALEDGRFIDTNVVDFIKWKQHANIELGPIGKTLQVTKADTQVIVKDSNESFTGCDDDDIGTVERESKQGQLEPVNNTTKSLTVSDSDPQAA